MYGFSKSRFGQPARPIMRQKSFGRAVCQGFFGLLFVLLQSALALSFDKVPSPRAVAARASYAVLVHSRASRASCSALSSSTLLWNVPTHPTRSRKLSRLTEPWCQNLHQIWSPQILVAKWVVQKLGGQMGGPNGWSKNFSSIFSKNLGHLIWPIFLAPFLVRWRGLCHIFLGSNFGHLIWHILVWDFGHIEVQRRGTPEGARFFSPGAEAPSRPHTYRTDSARVSTRFLFLSVVGGCF